MKKEYATVYTIKFDVSSFARNAEEARLINRATAETVIRVLRAAWTDSGTTLVSEGETVEIKNEL